MSRRLYILRNRQSIPVNDLDEWGRDYFEHLDDYWVGVDTIGGVKVTTRFLGMDHSDSDPPLVFATLIAGGHDIPVQCYSTWDEAEAGHKRWVEKVKEGSHVST